MGRVILTYKGGRKESLKCKSEAKAFEISKKRPNVTQWAFYGDNDTVPRERKQVAQYIPASFEELDRMMRKQGLIS